MGGAHAFAFSLPLALWPPGTLELLLGSGVWSWQGVDICIGPSLSPAAHLKRDGLLGLCGDLSGLGQSLPPGALRAGVHFRGLGESGGGHEPRPGGLQGWLADQQAVFAHELPATRKGAPASDEGLEQSSRVHLFPRLMKWDGLTHLSVSLTTVSKVPNGNAT